MKSLRGVAQFGRALRSGRRGRKFESCRLDLRHLRPVGQAVKTKASHALNPGSIPGQVILEMLWNLFNKQKSRSNRIVLLANSRSPSACFARLTVCLCNE